MSTEPHVAAGSAPRASAAVTPVEHELLQRVADRDRSFSRDIIHNFAEMERCDAEVRALQKLEQKGWILLRWNHLTHHGERYAAVPLISEQGRIALRRQNR